MSDCTSRTEINIPVNKQTSGRNVLVCCSTDGVEDVRDAFSGHLAQSLVQHGAHVQRVAHVDEASNHRVQVLLLELAHRVCKGSLTRVPDKLQYTAYTPL